MKRTIIGWVAVLTLAVAASAGAQSGTVEERLTLLESEVLDLRQDVTELQGLHGITTTTSTTTTTTSTTTLPPTTTTTTDAPTTTTMAPVPTRIGIVGCSMTKNANEGYASLGGTKFWSNGGLGYGAGSIYRWLLDEPNPKFHGYWWDFTTRLAAEPATDAIVWGLCTTNGSTNDYDPGPPVNIDNALAVLAGIEERAPGIPIYVIAQPDYTGATCDLAGSSGPSNMLALRDELVAGGHVLLGPDQGPLDSSQVGSDDCHANTAGKQLLGSQLLAFFG